MFHCRVKLAWLAHRSSGLADRGAGTVLKVVAPPKRPGFAEHAARRQPRPTRLEGPPSLRSVRRVALERRDGRRLRFCNILSSFSGGICQ